MGPGYAPSGRRKRGRCPDERKDGPGGEARGTAGEEGRAGDGGGASGGGPAGPGGAVQLRGSGGDGLPDLRPAMPAMLHGRNVSKAAGEGGERRSAVPSAAGAPSGVATDGALRSLRSALAHGGSGSGVGRAASVGAEAAGPAGRGLDEGGGAALALGRGRVRDHEVPELLRHLDQGLGLLGVEAVADGVGDLLPGGVSADDAGAAELVDEEGTGLVDDAVRCRVHESSVPQIVTEVKSFMSVGRGMRVAVPGESTTAPAVRSEGVDLHLDQEDEHLAPRARVPGARTTSSLPSALVPGRWQTGPVSITYAGHTVGYTETESGRRFIVQCSCGLGHPRWRGDKPPTKATENVAVIDCFRHLRKVRTEAQRVARLTGQRASAIPKAEGSTLRIGT